LEQGEVAVNVTDKKVWVGNAATTPVQLLGGGADGSFTNISVSSVATFGAGTVSAPAITTTGDTNTGIFFPAADTIAFTEGGTEAMRIDSSGNLLLNQTTQPTNGGRISVNGVVASTGFRVRSGVSGSLGSNTFNINWTGSAALYIDNTNLGNIQLSSDYRIKRNIETQTVPALERVMALRPVTYQMADYGGMFVATDEIREGFIAHEVQEVIPSGAEGQKDEENRIQNLRVDAILSVAVKAIQEQQAIITDLKSRITALESK
jgi:hypothetical protein